MEGIVTDKNGTPYVSYSDGAHNNRVTVMRFDGTNWVDVGKPGFSAGSSDGASTRLTTDISGDVFLAYQNYSLTDAITVMKAALGYSQ